MQFKAKIQAFSGMSPYRQSLHNLVSGGVLVEADRNVGGIGQFDILREFPVESSYGFDDEKSKRSEPVQVFGEGFVGTVGFGGSPESNLRCHTGDLLKDGQRDNFNDL